MGSPGRIQQVAMNLVQNAADATAGLPEPRLAISARRVGDSIEVRFEDNGPGLSPVQLAHCFEPFYTTKPVGKGTGLGLSISYGLVAQQGGRLAAANAQAGGACFVMTLPLHSPPSAPAARRAGTEPPGQGSG
jgi:two-component system sensor histidine kinase HupT/HoxJ